MPDADALAHSEHLRQLVQEQVIAAGGAIPFSRFMELALYAPGLGYYSAGARKFGPGGDFVTAPELGPLFAATVADALAPVLQQLGPGATMLELGGGSGAFAEVALKRLLALDALPARYALLEPSADLRERQRERLRRRLPPLLFELVEWLDGPMPDDWDGVARLAADRAAPVAIQSDALTAAGVRALLLGWGGSPRAVDLALTRSLLAPEAP